MALPCARADFSRLVGLKTWKNFSPRTVGDADDLKCDVPHMFQHPPEWHLSSLDIKWMSSTGRGGKNAREAWIICRARNDDDVVCVMCCWASEKHTTKTHCHITVSLPLRTLTVVTGQPADLRPRPPPRCRRRGLQRPSSRRPERRHCPPPCCHRQCCGRSTATVSCARPPLRCRYRGIRHPPTLRPEHGHRPGRPPAAALPPLWAPAPAPTAVALRSPVPVPPLRPPRSRKSATETLPAGTTPQRRLRTGHERVSGRWRQISSVVVSSA